MTEHPLELLREVEAIVIRSGPIYSTDGSAVDILDAVRKWDAEQAAASSQPAADLDPGADAPATVAHVPRCNGWTSTLLRGWGRPCAPAVGHHGDCR